MAAPKGLHALARLHGVQTAFRSNDGGRVAASPEAILAALRALRVPAESAADVPRLLSHRRRELAERVLEPVVVGWLDDEGDGAAAGRVTLRLPPRHRDGDVRLVVALEEGGERTRAVPLQSAEVVDASEVDGVTFRIVSIPLPDGLPPGYHHLAVAAGPARWEARLIVAPRRAAGWDRVADRPAWGVFAPLYALREEGRPTPDFSLLDALARRVAERGGSVVGTLPVLAAFLDRPYEPSPYAPASRLFWNEMYVDPAAAPGADALPEDARSALSWKADERWLDAGRLMAARRPALEALARRFYDGDPEADLAAFRARNPRVDDYARFRALTEARGTWGEWPERLRARDVRPTDYDADLARYHVYVQWLAERQLAEAMERAADRGVSLYLDLPLGVHPDGYDVWRDRALFARGASAGAPPDPLAPQGQDWGFPPLHPEATRMDGHRYFASCIRKHLRFAKILRIDHVMQLHRMFWVPDGDARHGVYVRYPAEELHAVLCLESRRAGAVIVGEDLGTVPTAVRRDMKRHGLFGMYVAQFELEEMGGAKGAKNAKDAKNAKALVPRGVRAGVVASVGTHDTPTFAGWWTGRDAELRGEVGVVSEAEAAAEVEGRGRMREELLAGLERSTTSAARNTRAAEDRGGGAAEVAEVAEVAEAAEAAEAPGDAAAFGVLEWLHRHMGGSRAGLVLATLEDLWLEREPQNVPGTTGERNWRRRSARPLEALEGGEAERQMAELDEARRGAR